MHLILNSGLQLEKSWCRVLPALQESHMMLAATVNDSSLFALNLISSFIDHIFAFGNSVIVRSQQNYTLKLLSTISRPWLHSQISTLTERSQILLPRPAKYVTNQARVFWYLLRIRLVGRSQMTFPVLMRAGLLLRLPFSSQGQRLLQSHH